MASAAPVPPDRVVQPHPSTGFDLFILSMYEKPGWRTRTAGDRIHVPHPGTAVRYQDNLYEVIAIEPAAGTHYTYRYALKKWDDRNVVRQVVTYSQEIERVVAKQIHEQIKQHRKHTWMIYLFPFTGLAPTPLLRRWQREWGLPMRGVSFASVFFWAVFAFVFVPVLFKTRGMGLLTAVVIYIFMEQIPRFYWLLMSNEAEGSKAVTAAWGIGNLLRGLQPDGTPRRRGEKDFAAERDEVRMMREGPWDVEVRSLFRDSVLLGEAPVLYDGAAYKPLGYAQEGTGLYRRYVFRLKKIEEGSPDYRRPRREYHPEHTPEQVAKLIPYERKRDTVHAWALLCGYLPATRQLLLQDQYDYNPAEWTERSAWVMLLAVGAQFLMQWGKPFGLPYLPAIYFGVESAYRLALARSRAEPTGSALGWVLGPLLRF